MDPSLLAQMVKTLPAMQETWVQSLGWEDPPEKGMVIHFRTLPGGFHGQISLAGYSPWGCKELDMTELVIHFCDTELPNVCRKEKPTHGNLQVHAGGIIYHHILL